MHKEWRGRGSHLTPARIFLTVPMLVLFDVKACVRTIRGGGDSVFPLAARPMGRAICTFGPLHAAWNSLATVVFGGKISSGGWVTSKWSNSAEDAEGPWMRLRVTSACVLISVIMLWHGGAIARGQTVANWLNPVSGTWTDSTKWSTNPFFPHNSSPAGSTYSALVASSGATHTISLTSSVTLSGLSLSSSDAAIDHTAGTLQLLGNGQVGTGTYQLAHGTIAGAGNLSIGGVFSINDGTLAKATSGSTGTVSVLPGGTLNVEGTVYLNRTIENAGVVNATGGTINLTGGTFTNLANGVVNISSGVEFGHDHTSGEISTAERSTSRQVEASPPSSTPIP